MDGAEEEQKSDLVPPWLEPLLLSAFFTVCPAHTNSTRSERNMYCIDCAGNAFCYYCRSADHVNHRVIQIRRSSYHDVVRVAEIEKVLDISGVQTYVINSARVLFLNERPQPRTGKMVAHACEICGRSLLDSFRFCSLGCKLVGIKRKGNACFVVESSNIDKDVRRRKEEEGYLSTTNTSAPSSNARRRKGIPHRAPLAS